jgi:hypothetical protein
MGGASGSTPTCKTRFALPGGVAGSAADKAPMPASTKTTTMQPTQAPGESPPRENALCCLIDEEEELTRFRCSIMQQRP